MIFYLLLAVLFILPSSSLEFTYYDYEELNQEILNLAEQYPNLLKVTTAQEEYALPSPGRCGEEDCLQYIVHLTNFDTYTNEKAIRPEFFYSGCLHGNERVGPTTALETIRLLVENYETNDNPWLKRLVDTRSMFFMPSANALGYYENVREENFIDPNRDFAFDRADENCMNTITARAINELWRDHMFQISLTIHSGIRMIGYAWGDITSGFDFTSPDQNAQAAISASLSAYAGKFEEYSNPGFAPDPSLYERYTYPQGPITPLLYPVAGGFEDYAYAASWASQTNVCRPRSNGDYPIEKTTYTDSQLRAYNILIESDDAKEPAPDTLGNSDGLLKADGDGQGHLPRHIRITLTTIDSVQPYIQVVNMKTNEQSCSQASLSQDINVAFSAVSVGETYPTVEALTSEGLSMSYEVGGSFEVSNTQVYIFEKPIDWDESTKITPEVFANLTDSVRNITSSQSGFTRWVGAGAAGYPSTQRDQSIYSDYVELELDTSDNVHDREQYPYIPAWKFCFDSPDQEGEYLIVARAVVDEKWGEVPTNSTPNDIFTAQGHLAQARTNTSWFKENNGFIVQGQVEWFSQPVPLNVVAPVVDPPNDDDDDGNSTGDDGDSPGDDDGGNTPNDDDDDGNTPDDDDDGNTPNDDDDDGNTPNDDDDGNTPNDDDDDGNTPNDDDDELSDEEPRLDYLTVAMLSLLLVIVGSVSFCYARNWIKEYINTQIQRGSQQDTEYRASL